MRISLILSTQYIYDHFSRSSNLSGMAGRPAAIRRRRWSRRLNKCELYELARRSTLTGTPFDAGVFDAWS
jgi:hypothetical protein